MYNQPLWAQDAEDDENVIWLSYVTKEMALSLDPDQLQGLVDELNDAVQQICESYEVA